MFLAFEHHSAINILDKHWLNSLYLLTLYCTHYESNKKKISDSLFLHKIDLIFFFKIIMCAGVLFVYVALRQNCSTMGRKDIDSCSLKG